MRDCGCSALANSWLVGFERVAAASASAHLRACPAASTTMPLFSACVRGGTPVPNGGRRIPQDCRASATGSEERRRYGRVYSTTRFTPSHLPPPPFDAARPRGLSRSRRTTSSWRKKIYASSGTTQGQRICLRCYSMRPALEASSTAYTPCLRGHRCACDRNLDGGPSPSKACRWRESAEAGRKSLRKPSSSAKEKTLKIWSFRHGDSGSGSKTKAYGTRRQQQEHLPAHVSFR
ncbi:hypothetical protein MRX96_048078 [Rhipicephalus microplus]